MEPIKVTIQGLAPLLMHSDRFANPLDPMTKAHKALTGKRKKTDDDHEAIAKSEWRGSLYYDDEIGVFVPGQNIDATLIGGAKLQKLGTAFKRGVMVLEDKLPLEYEGPKNPDKLINDERFVDVRGVRVGTAKLMRCRPIFNKWKLSFTVMFNPDVVNREDVLKAIEDAGIMVGLCDYRPRFGKFEIVEAA